MTRITPRRTHWLCASLLAIALPAQSALLDRGDGLVYDDVLDVSWLKDANLAASESFGIAGIAENGWMDFASALDWIAALNDNAYLGYTGWRLPSVDRDGNGILVNCATAMASDCRDNELGYMYHQNGVTPAQPGPFLNLQSRIHWSGDGETASQVLAFSFNSANQGLTPKQNNFVAWAVLDGDVALVPIPAAAWLFAGGLGLLAGLRRHRS